MRTASHKVKVIFNPMSLLPLYHGQLVFPFEQLLPELLEGRLLLQGQLVKLVVEAVDFVSTFGSIFNRLGDGRWCSFSTLRLPLAFLRLGESAFIMNRLLAPSLNRRLRRHSPAPAAMWSRGRTMI